jgi:hypothetical protein
LICGTGESNGHFWFIAEIRTSSPEDRKNWETGGLIHVRGDRQNLGGLVFVTEDFHEPAAEAEEGRQQRFQARGLDR